MDEGDVDKKVARAGEARPRRLLAVAAVLSLATVLATAPPAFAVRDPVGSGGVQLKLSGGFERLLERNGVKMQRKEFTIREGSFDSTAGSGTLILDGRLKFKKGQRTVALRNVTARLGNGGVLKAGGAKLFRLSGGNVDRKGFGADINGVNVKLLQQGARTLSRKLGLHSLHAANAGTLSVSEKPETVRVTGGQTKVVPSLDPNSAIAFKLADHCVDPILSVDAIPPASQDSNLNFFFPVVGGTAGPSGKAGLTVHAGGTQINKDPLKDEGPCGGVPDDTNVQTTGLQIDLKTNHVFAEAVINGYPPPLGGPKGVAIAFDIDRKLVKVDARAKAKTITFSNLVLSLSPASTIFLNLVFPNDSGIASRDFIAGDLFGTATMTVNTR